MTYIYLDEAGDTGIRGSKYFIISIIITKNPKEIANAIKRIKKNLRAKKQKKKQELKFYNSTDRVRTLVLRTLKRKDIEVSYFAIRKSKEISDSNQLYCVWSDNLIKNALLGKKPKFVEINLDKRLTKSYESVFDKLVQDSIRNVFDHNIKVEIKHVNSTEDRVLQAVDFISGAIFYNYEHNNSSFYNIISSCIRQKLIEE